MKPDSNDNVPDRYYKDDCGTLRGNDDPLPPDPDEAYDDMRQKRIEGFDDGFRKFVNKTFGGK